METMDNEGTSGDSGSPTVVDLNTDSSDASRSDTSGSLAGAGGDDNNEDDDDDDNEDEEKAEKTGMIQSQSKSTAAELTNLLANVIMWSDNNVSDEITETTLHTDDEGVHLNLEDQTDLSNEAIESDETRGATTAANDETTITPTLESPIVNGSPDTDDQKNNMKHSLTLSVNPISENKDQLESMMQDLLINDVSNNNNKKKSSTSSSSSPSSLSSTSPLTSPGSSATTSTTATATTPTTLRNVGPRLAKKETLKEKKRREKRDAKKNGAGRSASAGSSSANSTGTGNDMHCVYCNVTFYNRPDFQNHCRSEKHQHAIMSDEGRTWKYRPPPRGVGSELYSLCSNMATEGFCRFGPQCVEAHSADELREWKDRYDFRQKKSQKAAKMFGKSFADLIIEKLSAAKIKESVLRERIEGVTCSCDKPLTITATSKTSEMSWTFEMTTKKFILHNLALLNEVNRSHFYIVSVQHLGEDVEGRSGREKEVNREYQLETDTGKNPLQEWSHPEPILFTHCSKMTYRIKIGFRAEIFGTFRQSIVFSFGFEPHLRQDICVEVVPDSESVDEKVQELQETLVKQAERWDSKNSTIVDFDPPVTSLSPEDEALVLKYSPPQPSTFRVSQNVLDPQLTRSNYRARLHELLCIEEMAQFDQVSQYNVVTKLLLTSRYLLMPTSASSSTAKYARPGELFGKMKLGSCLSEDTPAGRLILTNCSSLYLSRPSKAGKTDSRMAFVAYIEDTGKSTLYLRLSSAFVQSWNAVEDQEVEVEVQFQLNRLPICEMHFAIDKLPNVDLIHPDITEKVVIPWTPGKQWSEGLNSKLNPKQREAVVAITTPLTVRLPPILIIGPYGTGKTFTLGQAIKMVLNQDATSRVLVCTHSNSAADLYIREHLHPYIEKEKPDLKLLRVYYKNRWVQTVHATVQKYCLINTSENNRVFRYPTLEDVIDCQVVVATLSTSRFLSSLDLPNGHFTHILLDEAAQAMESEAILPFALASPSTRLVLAGDHMQLSPEVFSSFATEKRLNKSLLERLYDLYPQNYPVKILLCENYRSHEAIINYTSELFYEQKLIASGKQLEHDAWYPLTLFTARGEDVQDINSTSFYNNSEVYEVVERVAELQRTWPKAWGHRDENSIGIVTPYYDQVQRIRSELRKRKLFGVSVERVLNVQGKQFRAIFLSTVRTRKTCSNPSPNQEDMSDLDFGFLSNAKLLNTAITRAQSLVAVVGDPVALCSVGKCRKLWERFVEICHTHHSLFGITWSTLRAMLDGVELKRTYVLNPLAPEFIPRARRQREAWNWMAQTHALLSQAAAFGNPYFLPAPPRLIAPGFLAGPPPRSLPMPPPPPPPPPPSAFNPYVTVPPFPVPWMKLPPPLVGSMPDLSGAGIPFPLQIPPPPPSKQMPQWPPLVKSNFYLPHPGSPPRFMQGPIMMGSVASTLPGQISPRPTIAQMVAVSKYRPPMTSSITTSASMMLPPNLMIDPGMIRPSTSIVAGSMNSAAAGMRSATPISKVNGESSDHPSNYIFLKDGVHFPRAGAPPGHNQNSNIHGRLGIPDNVVDLLPQDLELLHFMQSPQLQQAWFNHLTVERGSHEAATFKDLMMRLQVNPEIAGVLKQQLMARKMASVADKAARQMHPPSPLPPSAYFQRFPMAQNQMQQPPPQMPPHKQPPPQLGPQRPPIMATDLEAILFREQMKQPPTSLASSACNTDSLLDDVVKHDPFLSEIFQPSDESSPDSGCWGSVNSILNTNKSKTNAVNGNSATSTLDGADAASRFSAIGDGASNVPLYLRRAGVTTCKTRDTPVASSMLFDSHNSTLKLLPDDDDFLLTPSQNSTSTFGSQQSSLAFSSATGRFRQEPVLSVSPNPSFSNSGSSLLSGYSNNSNSLTSAAPVTSSASSAFSSKPPALTYANVLRNPQLLRDSNDPLTRIRNLGTRTSLDGDQHNQQQHQQQQKLFSSFGGVGRW